MSGEYQPRLLMGHQVNGVRRYTCSCIGRSNFGAVLLDNGVALARNPAKLVAIENSDGAAIVLDDLVLLEKASGKADAGAVCAKHGGKKIVGDGQNRRIDAILGHEQPAREALLDSVQTIAGGGLRHLQTENHSSHLQFAMQLRSRRQQLAECGYGRLEAAA